MTSGMAAYSVRLHEFSIGWKPIYEFTVVQATT